MAGRSTPIRHERFHRVDRSDDHRTDVERDRDRILFTSAFRRLGGITQIVSPLEGHVYHNRLTHTLEVAQLARRIAQRIAKPRSDRELITRLGGLEPEVAEAAGLAHDLGHPPFGHVSEQVLDGMLRDVGLADGFEGNAQTFRILTRLSVRREESSGLNLTRASLDGVLKYPWLRRDGDRKWNAYESERSEFEWVRQRWDEGDTRKSLEAEIMDWADDIAYAVHDLEDFFRAGLIPLNQLVHDSDERERFLEAQQARDEQKGNNLPGETNPLRTALEGLIKNELATVPSGPYAGTHADRARLRSLTGVLINKYVSAISLNDEAVASPVSRVNIRQHEREEVNVLKRLSWHYVITHPSLLAQEHGHIKRIKELFQIFLDRAKTNESPSWGIFPGRWQSELRRSPGSSDEAQSARCRIAADFIASLTEQETIRLYQRLMGMDAGSVRDAIVY